MGLGRTVAVVVVGVVVVLVSAFPAFAAKGISDFIGVEGSTGNAPGQFDDQAGVDVNDPDPGGANENDSLDPYGNSTDGYLYVADEDNHRIQVFDSDQQFVFSFGGEVNATATANVCPRPGFPGDDCAKSGNDASGDAGYLDDPQGVAIDQVDGSVYVTDQDNIRIQKFTAAGEFVYMLGASVNQTSAAANICPRPGFPADVCEVGVSGTGDGQFGSTMEGHPAVDPNTRELWVPDAGGTSNRRMQKLDSDGTFVLKFGGNGSGIGQFGSGAPNHVAVDDDGRIYVLDDSSSNDWVERFASDGTGGEVFAGPELSGSPEPGRIAIDHNDPGSADDQIYVVKEVGGESVVKELDVDGNLLDTHGTGADLDVTNSAGGLAVNPATGSIYFSTESSGYEGVYVLNDIDGPLFAQVDAVTDITASTATLNATINPNGSRTSFRFEISEDGINYSPIPTTDEDAGLGTTAEQYAFAATDLKANTFYRVRVVATRVDGDEVTTGNLNFLTAQAPPVTASTGASQVSDTTAQLNGSVHPGGVPTSYWFEWGNDLYGNQAPVPAGSAGAGGVAVAVGETLAGLAPDTTYHYRLCAQNVHSPVPVCGADRVFTTRQAVTTPAGRTYEMVTDPDKPLRQGHAGLGSLTLDFARANTAAPSADGEAVRWGLFPGATSGEANHGFTWAETYEVYSRAPAGWTAEAVTTIAPVTGATNAVIEQAGSSADLQTTAWYSTPPLFDGDSHLAVRVMGDDGGPRGGGLYPWLDSSWFGSPLSSSKTWQAQIVDDGSHLVGSLSAGLADPGRSIVPADGGSAADSLNPAQEYGRSLHLSNAAFGWRPGDLVNECTGSLADGDQTGIPVRDAEGTDAVAAQGTGNVSGSTVSGLVTDSGAFAVGQQIVGSGLSVDITVVAVGPGTLTLSRSATSSGTGVALTAFSPGLLADDTIGVSGCESGSPTDIRGAALSGSQSLNGSSANAVSDDGDRVFFLSPDPDTNADPDGSSWRPDGSEPCAPTTGASTECPAQLYVRQYDDSSGATVRWLSRAEDALFDVPQAIGLLGHGASFEGASRDGSVVYFRTNAPLTVDDPNGGPLAGRPVIAGEASPNSWDLYRYELGADTGADPAGGDPGDRLTRVSGGPTGDADPNTNCLTIAVSGPRTGDCWGNSSSGATSPNGAGGVVRFMSDDGRRVYFVTAAQILGATNAPPAGGTTTPTGAGEQVNTASRNLYLYDADKTGAAAYEFIAELPFSTSVDASGDLDSCATFGHVNNGPLFSTEGNANDLGLLTGSNGPNCVRGSSSGDAVAFQTSGRLTSDDVDDAADIYLYEAGSDRLTRVSSPPPGVQPYVCQRRTPTSPVLERCNADFGRTGRAGISNRGGSFGSAGLRHWNIAERSDGSLEAVLFQSRLALDPDKTNGNGPVADTGGEGYMDVFEWRDGKVSLISTGDSPNSSFYSGNSLDGEHVFFWTEERISPWEIDARDGDLYNATTAEPIPGPVAPPPVCAVLGGGCHSADAGAVAVTARTAPESAVDNARAGERRRLAMVALGVKARKRAARTGRLALRVRTTGAGRLSVVVRDKVAKRKRVLAKAAKTVGTPGVATIRLRLNKAARRTLRAGRRLNMSIQVRQAGARPRSMTVRLRRAGS